MSDEIGLTELERELLELISMAGEPTTVLDEEMLESSPGRSEVEAALRGLLGRGLLVTERAVNAGSPRRSDGQAVYEDDWWALTRAGRAALGEEPRGRDRPQARVEAPPGRPNSSTRITDGGLSRLRSVANAAALPVLLLWP